MTRSDRKSGDSNGLPMAKPSSHGYPSDRHSIRHILGLHNTLPGNARDLDIFERYGIQREEVPGILRFDLKL